MNAATVWQWISRNIFTLVIAFALALVVWVSAVVNADPNVSGVLERKVPITYIGLEPRYKIINDYLQEVEISLEAPRSIWQQLNSDPASIVVQAELTSLAAGEHEIELVVMINQHLVRNLRSNPDRVQIVLEEIVSQTFAVNLVTTGALPVGYVAGEVRIEPTEVTVSGGASLISRVREARVQLDLNGATSTFTRTLTVQAVDASGRSVGDLAITPSFVRVAQPVSLQGGHRNVVVRVVTTGIVANGYRLSNYFANPASVVVFSEDLRLVEALPGYVETMPLDLTGADDDFEELLELNLPPGVTVASGPKVLVQVSIAAIESSLSVSVPVEVRGLGPGMEALVAPKSVDIIVSGPVPALRDLQPQDIRILVDLTGFQVGVYQLIPVVDFLPARLQKVSILPATVEVTLVALPTATPTTTPTPTGTQQPLITPTPTRRP